MYTNVIGISVNYHLHICISSVKEYTDLVVSLMVLNLST